MRPEDIEPEVEILPPEEKWYHKKGCIFALVIFLLFFAGVGLFCWQIYQYYQAIRTGNYTPQMQAVLKNVLDKEQLSSIVSKDDDPTYGNQEAKIVIIAFEDFQCPISEEQYPILKQVLPDYQDKILFVYRDFPTGHTYSQMSAEAANCAQEQGKFWEYYDLLYSNPTLITSETSFTDLAKQIDMNIESFSACVKAGKYNGEVNKDYMDGTIADVKGTPTFFINGYKVQGSYSAEVWRQVLDGLVKELY